MQRKLQYTCFVIFSLAFFLLMASMIVQVTAAFSAEQPSANPEKALNMTHEQTAAMAEGSEKMAETGMKQMRHGDDMHNMMQGCMMQSKTMTHMRDTKQFSDQSYLSGMIAHHKAAVAMAEAVLKNGKDPQVKKWAQDVINSQTPEIKQMQEWLATLGGEDEKAAAIMRDSMTDMMAKPMSQDVDRNFVAMMIGHHAGAVEMASGAVIASHDPKVVKLSRDIINAQLDEIMAYKEWLAKNPL